METSGSVVELETDRPVRSRRRNLDHPLFIRRVRPEHPKGGHAQPMATNGGIEYSVFADGVSGGSARGCQHFHSCLCQHVTARACGFRIFTLSWSNAGIMFSFLDQLPRALPEVLSYILCSGATPVRKDPLSNRAESPVPSQTQRFTGGRFRWVESIDLKYWPDRRRQTRAWKLADRVLY